MKNINKLRNEIDIIDDKLLDLLKHRSKLSIRIGNIKKNEKGEANLFRPERQIKILSRLFLNKDNLVKEKDIFKIWREIFTHQTSLQGKLKFLIPCFLSKKEKNIVHNSFGTILNINYFEDLNKAFSLVKRKQNHLLMLPFPGKTKRSNWWLDFNFKKLHVVASLPFITESKLFPQLLVISKFEPIIDINHSIIYKANSEINNLKFKKIAKLNNNYLYKSDILLKKRNLNILGAFPNLELAENYEKN